MDTRSSQNENLHQTIVICSLNITIIMWKKVNPHYNSELSNLLTRLVITILSTSADCQGEVSKRHQNWASLFPSALNYLMMVYINTEIKDFKPQLSIDVWLRMKLLQFLKMKLAVVMNRFHPAHCLVHLSIGRLVRLSSCTFLMFADGFFSCPNAWLAFSDCTCPLASHLIE